MGLESQFNILLVKAGQRGVCLSTSIDEDGEKRKEQGNWESVELRRRETGQSQ